MDKEVKVLSSSCLEDLLMKVNDSMNEGWKPYGKANFGDVENANGERQTELRLTMVRINNPEE